MDLFKKVDKLFFQKEKSGIDKKIDDEFHTYAENNPIMNEAKAKIEEAADNITDSLERELGKNTKNASKERPSVLDNYDARAEEWDSMIDQICDRESSRFKLCPSCNEAVDAKLDYCPHCNTRLPEGTLKDCCEFEFKEK